jgi:hypothetical protein
MSARKLLIGAGLLCLIAGGYMAWRVLHPPLSDREQIVANIESIRSYAEQRRAQAISGYFAENFAWNGMSRGQLTRQMALWMLQARDVQLQISNLDVALQGTGATTSGDYSAQFRSSEGAPLQNASGHFMLHWTKQKDVWKIDRIEGKDIQLPES